MVINYYYYSSFNEIKCVFNKLSNTCRNVLRYLFQFNYYLS